ncbi:MAG TPA: MFS transporter [Pyrinomonadaceae bacterium]|nr:MFS transporter [Pyrinomonadaceae bacterium]
MKVIQAEVRRDLETVGVEAAVERKKIRMPETLRALGHKNYRLFYGGQLVSLTGTWMQSVAQAWLVYRLTGSAATLGFVTFAGQIPGFLLAPVGGAIADSFSRHRILITTQALAMLLAFVLALLTLTGSVAVWHVYVLAALLGVVNAFDIPARQAFVADLVDREDLVNAIALNSSMINGARLVGPAMAGLLVASIGEGWCFFVNGVSYVAVIVGLLRMRVARQETGAAVDAERPSPVRRVVEGFSFVGRTAPIRALIILLGLISLFGMPYTVLMPVFADRILGVGASGLGMLLGAAGVGALCAALLLVARRGVRGMGRWVALSSAGFGAGLVLFSRLEDFRMAIAVLVFVGFSMILQISSSNTLVQAMVPDALRGRVMAVYSMMFLGMAPLGALLAGWLAERAGAANTVALGGVGCILSAIVFSLRLPALRREARALLVADRPGEVAQSGS